LSGSTEPGRRLDKRVGQRIGIGTLTIRQAHDQRETPLALANFADLPRADSFHNVQDITRRHAEALRSLRVNLHLQDRLARKLFASDLSPALDTAKHLLHLVGEFPQDLKVVTINLDADVGPDAGHQLVHAHLDRLAERHPQSGDLDEQLAHFLDQLRLRVGLFPLLPVLSARKKSESSTPIGSVAISALPRRVQILAISSLNSASSSFSMRSFTATASSTETPATRTVVPTMAPSPSLGRNSPPMCVAGTPLRRAGHGACEH